MFLNKTHYHIYKSKKDYITITYIQFKKNYEMAKHYLLLSTAFGIFSRNLLYIKADVAKNAKFINFHSTKLITIQYRKNMVKVGAKFLKT
jgi:hypothetical protein